MKASWLTLIIVILNKIFWFFGLHVGNVLAPVMSSLWGDANLNSLAPRFLIYGRITPSVPLSGSMPLATISILWMAPWSSFAVKWLEIGDTPYGLNIGEPVMYGGASSSA